VSFDLDTATLSDAEIRPENLRRLAKALGIGRAATATRKQLARMVAAAIARDRRGAPRPATRRDSKPENLVLPMVAPGRGGEGGTPQAVADGANVCPACHGVIVELEDHHGWCVEGLRAVAAMGDRHR
jgi:hypothetical protein